MQSGSFSSDGVGEFVSRVTVNGVDRPHASWSVDREIAGDLPAQVSYGAGLRQATGNIDWGLPAVVAGEPLSPWRRNFWMPRRGDRVVIWQGDGATEWIQFTGVIDKTTGTVGDGFSSRVIDDYDQLAATVRHEAMLAAMPPVSPGGSYRRVGLTQVYYVDYAARAGGFYATPPRSPHAVLHVPANGSLWPHAGLCVTCDAQSGAYPANRFSPWGFATGNFTATYVAASPQPASTPVQLTAMIAPNHSGFWYMRAAYGSTYVQMSVNSNLQLVARVGTTQVASIYLTEPDCVVQMLVKGGEVTLRASTGQSATGSASFSGSTLMGTITVSADADSAVGGIQVSHPEAGQEFREQGFVRSAAINVADTTLMGILPAVPAITGESAASLLDRISTTTLSACWIDELGVLRWWPAKSFQARNPRGYIDTDRDVFAMDWEESLLSSASTVEVDYKNPTVRVSQYTTVELWRGRGESFSSLEEKVEFVGPETDTAWYGVDTSLQRVSNANWSLLNTPDQSFFGCYFMQNGDVISEAGLAISATFDPVGVERFKLRQYVSAMPAGVTAVTRAREDLLDIWLPYRGQDLPVVRGHGITTWEDAAHKPSQTVRRGVELIHDTDVWVPPDIISRVFDYLREQTDEPAPVITGLDAWPDPRRQVGDVTTIRSEVFLGVVLTVLVVGMSCSHGRDGAGQTLDVRVMAVDVTQQTYREFDQSLLAGLTYQQLQALGPIPQTYQQFNEEA